MKKVGQIWKRDRAENFLIKILRIINHDSCVCEVVNMGATDTYFNPVFVKGYVSTYTDLEHRFQLYCTRYEEKS